MNGDDYVKVRAEIKRTTDDAFQIALKYTVGVWIPFSLTKTLDEVRIRRANRGSTIEFSLRLWKAKELGL